MQKAQNRRKVYIKNIWKTEHKKVCMQTIRVPKLLKNQQSIQPIVLLTGPEMLKTWSLNLFSFPQQLEWSDNDMLSVVQNCMDFPIPRPALTDRRVVTHCTARGERSKCCLLPETKKVMSQQNRNILNTYIINYCMKSYSWRHFLAFSAVTSAVTYSKSIWKLFLFLLR